MDDALGTERPRLGALVASLAESADAVEDDAAAAALAVDSVHMDLPIELAVELADDGALTLAAEPPSQRTLTSVLPVWHRLRVTVGR